MNEEKLIELWKKEEEYAFSGWDFSHIDGRYSQAELPWSYRDEALNGLFPEHHLLDMETGGGEFLLGLGHPHIRTTVTEGYLPNLELCRQRLTPLGIEVCYAQGEEKLPFADQSFERVLNRHGSFRADECMRVLRPGGRFVTQQVGGQNDHELVESVMGEWNPQFPGHDLEQNVAALIDAGFDIERAEKCFAPIRFFDTGALVFFAKVLPWEFIGFSVDTCRERLLEIEERIRRDGFIEGTIHRFLIAARRKNA